MELKQLGGSAQPWALFWCQDGVKWVFSMLPKLTSPNTCPVFWRSPNCLLEDAVPTTSHHSLSRGQATPDPGGSSFSTLRMDLRWLMVTPQAHKVGDRPTRACPRGGMWEGEDNTQSGEELPSASPGLGLAMSWRRLSWPPSV